jgi:hypothetical protein
MAASTSEAGYNARVEDFRDVEYPMLNGNFARPYNLTNDAILP